MTTVRFIVSPGTRLVTLTRSPAFGLLLLIEIVAEFAVFVGFVLVAVKLALVLSAVAVRPIRTSPASAMPARRLSLRICVVPFSCPLRRSLSCLASWSGGVFCWGNIRLRSEALHRLQGGGHGPIGRSPRPQSCCESPDVRARDPGGIRPRRPCGLLRSAGLCQTLAEGGAAAGPEIQHLDALLGPGTGTPPEDGRRGERDDAGARQDHLLEVHEEVETVGDDAQGDEDEHLDLADDHQEDQGERGRAEGLLGAVGEGNVEDAAHGRDYACKRTVEQARPYSSVAERSGPIPTMPTGAPTVASIFSRYAVASRGRWARSRMPSSGARQPEQLSYTGIARSSTCVGGISLVRPPSSKYATQNGMFSYAPSTSSFVTAISVNALSRCACRAATASNHPMRRGRPVVAPYSSAISRSASPSFDFISVGNGPSPTAVEYAFTTPMTRVM